MFSEALHNGLVTSKIIMSIFIDDVTTDDSS